MEIISMTEEEKEFSAKFMEFEKQKFLLEKEFVINECKLLDSDGYPTHHALNLISNWHWSDSKGWFEFIKSIWWMPDWGWHEGDAKDEFDENKTSYRYNISTGGWSGNESIIDAMKKNTILWTTTWVQSRRGGHYIFELKEFE